jgi:methylamine dehydrogenase light chain
MNTDRDDDLLGRILGAVDGIASRTTRFLADHTSRRFFLGRLGAVMAGVGALPMLPVYREAHAAAELDELGDPQSCDYWRYCAFSGSLCSCCGGTLTQCPPGSETASVAWVGTCHNPTDGKDYLISYNDCCGKSSCGRCGCHRSEGDRPVYFPAKANSILWCFGSKSHAYHCTLALVIGEVEPGLAASGG